MPRAPRTAHPKPFRWRTASTCCRTWPRRWNWCSRPTPASCATPSRPSGGPLPLKGLLCAPTRHLRPNGRWPWRPRARGGGWGRPRGGGGPCAPGGPGGGAPPHSASGPPPAPPPPPKRPLARAAARRERRMATHRRVWELWRQGWPGEEIARHLGIGRTTTYRHLKSEAFPERKGRSDAGRSSLDPWSDWVIERWNGGQRNGRRMLRELRGMGFSGNYATVLRYLNRLRAAQDGAAPPRRPQARPGPPLVAAPKRVLTPRTAVWAVLRRPERRSAEDRALLATLRGQSPELDAAVALDEGFTALVRGRRPELLDPWLKVMERDLEALGPWPPPG